MNEFRVRVGTLIPSLIGVSILVLGSTCGGGSSKSSSVGGGGSQGGGEESTSPQPEDFLGGWEIVAAGLDSACLSGLQARIESSDLKLEIGEWCSSGKYQFDCSGRFEVSVPSAMIHISSAPACEAPRFEAWAYIFVEDGEVEWDPVEQTLLVQGSTHRSDGPCPTGGRVTLTHGSWWNVPDPPILAYGGCRVMFHWDSSKNEFEFVEGSAWTSPLMKPPFLWGTGEMLEGSLAIAN